MSTEQIEKIACQECGAQVHSIEKHLKDKQCSADMTLQDYQAKYPEAPVLSDIARKKLEEVLAAKRAAATQPTIAAMAGALAAVTPLHAAPQTMPLHEVFSLGAVKAAMGNKGGPIGITVHPRAGEFIGMIPDVDANYVYDIENLKNAMMALELVIPLYVWGHAGTGKTTLLEQIHARTNRPLLRVQHTINTEERDVVGQWTVKDGNTIFVLGPLAMAMKYGWTYLADEYDFALPAVTAVYQPILEGKSLVIKDADHENRIIRPHPNFRFIATGNTNGSGDETGLYQGTQLQNAANYDRFGVVIEQKYLPAPLEAQAIAGQSGISKTDAEKLVDFAGRVRQCYESNEISATVSPRALINAAKLGIRKGSWRSGLNLAFINKLSKVDRAAVDGLAQRVFAGS